MVARALFLNLLFYFFEFGEANILNDLDVDLPPHIVRVPLKNGMEFQGVSRGVLLKIMAGLEEAINDNLAREHHGKTLEYTAQFANNKYTKPFIYPKYKGV